MKKNLTKEEADLFKNIVTFNKDYGSKGWNFKNRKAEKIDISGILFKGSVISNVDLIKIKMKDSVFEDTEFSNVSILHYSDLSGSTFKNIIFKNCKFIEFIVIDNSKFINCKFINNELVRISFNKSIFENCQFKNNKIIGSEFDGSQLNRIEFNNSNLDTVSFTDKAVAKDLSFRDCNIKFTGFGGKFENISFKECVLDNTRFNNSEIQNLVIENCKKLVGVSFGELTLENAVVRNCDEYQHPMIDLSKVVNLSIINCRRIIHFDFFKSEFSGNNIIKDVNIIGVQLKKTKLTNLQFENVSFDDFFFAKKVTFENMKLKDVKYLEKFNVEKMEDVEYINSDKFPEK